MSNFSNQKDIKKPVSPFLLFLTKKRNEYEEKKIGRFNIAQNKELWNNMPEIEKKPFYDEYEEKKAQYEKAIKNKIEQESDLLTNNQGFNSSIKTDGPMHQNIIIHHRENIRKTMLYQGAKETNNNYHNEVNMNINENNNKNTTNNPFLINNPLNNNQHNIQKNPPFNFMTGNPFIENSNNKNINPFLQNNSLNNDVTNIRKNNLNNFNDKKDIKLKRPVTPFFLFCKKIINEYNEKNKERPTPQQLNKMWNELSAYEKNEFCSGYEEKKAKYEQSIINK